MSDDTDEQFECEDCGETFRNTNQLNGHKASCDGGAADEPTEDDTDTESMNNDSDDDVSSIKAELSTVMAGSAPLENLHAQHEGGLNYSVLSARNGGATYHYVRLGDEPECTCGDFKFNRDENERDPCAHIVAAVFADRLDSEEITSQAMLNHGHQMASAAETLEDVGSMLENAVIKLRDAHAGVTAEQMDDGSSDSQNAESEGTDSSAPQTGVTAPDKATELQSAYDAVVDDMQVQAHDGYVWVQTGRDTPDTLPGPGNVEVFQAFLQNSDAVEYIHDDHEDVDSKPGEYWKNRIDPSDVDDYIAEVLQ